MNDDEEIGPYDELTVEELQQIASDREIAGRSSMNKAELILAITEWDANRSQQIRDGEIYAIRQEMAEIRLQNQEILERLKAMGRGQNYAMVAPSGDPFIYQTR